MFGSVTSQEGAQRASAEHHRRLVEAPVIAHQLGEDHQERERQAVGGVGGDRRRQIAGEPQDVAIERQRRDADQDLRDEQGRYEESRSGAPRQRER